jgi:hypothetical protein
MDLGGMTMRGVPITVIRTEPGFFIRFTGVSVINALYARLRLPE